MELARPFIRLPFSFDAERLAEEASALPATAWMAHPSRMQGNSAVALISRDAGDNDEFDGAMKMTPHLEMCPYTQQVMGSFDEVLARSRLMRLAPGCEVSTHVDFNYHWYSRVRIHVPVITEPDVIFYCADRNVHMRPGECWIFNSWRRHRVVNGGKHDRIHLVIDLAGSSRFWRIVRDMESLDPLSDGDEIARRIRPLPYETGKAVTIETEQFNTAPVMAPGELDALVSDLVNDFAANPDNSAELIAHYENILMDFCKDWRETWHRFGYRRSGLAHYSKVIESLQQRMHPNPRALVTCSNEIGVNPIIVQRILRPALSVDMLNQFDAAFRSGE